MMCQSLFPFESRNCYKSVQPPSLRFISVDSVKRSIKMTFRFVFSACLLVAMVSCFVMDKPEQTSLDHGYYSCSYGEIEHNGKCYFFSKDLVSWYDAMSFCALAMSKHGSPAILAMISNGAENSFLRRNVKRRGSHHYWVGATDVVHHGRYAWYGRRDFNYADKHLWIRGQPDNYKGKEHCAEYHPNGRLNDIDCECKRFFICERDL